MENTQSNKEKFFAQYWGQKVGKVNSYHQNVISKVCEANISSIDYLELKPLSSITDEDAKKLGYSSPLLLKKHSSFHVDELRALGYALWWHGLSVEKQIEYGWIKLKSE